MNNNTVICIVAVISSVLGFTVSSMRHETEQRSVTIIQAEMFCNTVNMELKHIVYNKKISKWSFQCK